MRILHAELFMCPCGSCVRVRVFGAGLACACVSMRACACFVGQLPVRACACFHIALALALRRLPGRACACFARVGVWACGLHLC